MLIRQFAKATQSRFVKIEGARPDARTTREDELRVFAEQLAAQTGCEDTTPSNWLNAFIRLSGRIRDDERTVVLLDEILWLGFGEPMFADIFRIAFLPKSVLRVDFDEMFSDVVTHQPKFAATAARALVEPAKETIDAGSFAFDGMDRFASWKEKVRRFAAPREMSVRTALVYDGRLAPSVEADGYFDAIVPFSRLLGLN